MMDKVTIGIAGTVDSLSGLQPLMDIDSPFDLGQSPDLVESLMGEEYYIELRHTPKFISLRYIARPGRVHGYHESRPGCLWIALTVPHDKRFAYGVSPFTVLMDVLDTFRKYYMTRRSDDSFEFNPGTYLRAPIDELLGKYPLEDFLGHYVVMSGVRRGVVCPHDTEGMTRFFADTQYEEFEDYGTVIVTLAQVGKGAIPVRIPRPIHYEVFWSDRLMGTLLSPDQRFDYHFLPSDDVHDAVDVSFTLSELRRGEWTSVARVDDVCERIVLSPSFPERCFRVDFEFRSTSGDLAAIPVTPDDFFLATPGGSMRKCLMHDAGKVFAEFRGAEANEKWHVRFNGNSDEKKFRFAATAVHPKEGHPVIVSLTPFADFQGLLFSGSGFLEGDTYMEIEFSNGDIFKFPVRKDFQRLLKGRNQSDVVSVRLVSDLCRYPELKRSYDPLSGFLNVSLGASPVPISDKPAATIRPFENLTFPEKVKEWFNGKSVKNGLFLLSLILALCVGIGSSQAWQKHESAKPELPKKDVKDLAVENPSTVVEESKGKSQVEDKVGGTQDDVDDDQVRRGHQEQQPKHYMMSLSDVDKMDRYFDLMTKLQDKDGNPLTFSQVNQINAWQKGITRQADHTDLGDKFKFIKQYIGKYVQAAIEVENIKKGTYRGLGWTVEDYYNDESRVLPKINNACRGENLKEFRVAIQILYIIGDDDLKNQKKMVFISRAVLSNAPNDKKILEDVDSFSGIMKAYNSF